MQMAPKMITADIRLCFGNGLLLLSLSDLYLAVAKPLIPDAVEPCNQEANFHEAWSEPSAMGTLALVERISPGPHDNM